jgi:Sulfotransferase domain
MGGIYWLASYPKSGNTWFRAFVQNLRVDDDAPVDINQIYTGAIAGARVWIDEVLGFDTADLTHDEVDRLRPHVYRWSADDGEIGYHKIHDAYTRLPDGEPLVAREGTLGALYIVRNPLDVVASFADHMGCTIDEAVAKMGDANFEIAPRGGLFHQARQRLLSWSGHLESWIDCPELRCEVVRYEDMLHRPLETFTRAARFLELPDDAARVEKAVRFAAFEELRRQEAERGFAEKSARAPQFFRRGIAGGWREELDDEQVAQVIADHGPMMRRLGYLDAAGQPGTDSEFG